MLSDVIMILVFGIKYDRSGIEMTEFSIGLDVGPRSPQNERKAREVVLVMVSAEEFQE